MSTRPLSTPRQIYELLRWEVTLALRDRYLLGSILLYVASTAVIVYTAAGSQLGGVVFNAFFWVIVFFGATIATGRSFIREGARRRYYYYTIVDPLALLAGKLCYNVLLIWILSAVAYFLLSLLTSTDVVVAPLPFITAVLLGGIGLSAVLTFVSALAARAGGSGTLMAILSFPLVIPLLQLLVNLGLFGIDVGSTDVAQPVYLTVALDLFAVAMGIVLFPFVWRD